MVYFSCGTCGSTLKKNQVEKHSFQCKTYGALSCIDCNKDFAGDDYKLHTKCVSEIERYSAKGWQPPANHNKGEKKQQAWLEVVQATLDKAGNTLKPTTRNLLNTLTKHDNVPRKRPKFLNFINNVTRRQFDDRTVAEVWDLLEAQWKLDKPTPNTNGTSNGTKKDEPKIDDEPAAEASPDTETQVPKKKKKQKRSVEETQPQEEPRVEDEPAAEASPDTDPQVSKKKKKKKRSIEETQPEEELKIEAELEAEVFPDTEHVPKKKKRQKRSLEETQPQEELKAEEEPAAEASPDLDTESPVPKKKKKKRSVE